MCHTLPLDEIRVSFERVGAEELGIVSTVRATARTGVEMEALVAVSAAALCVYDMVKAADRGVIIGPIRLEAKSGGRSGDYRRDGSEERA